ncbi:hypothetical protein NKW84_17840 [Acetobacter senegalensis]|uniref:hypothetical protein n=1 Tax=Acetobacter senegalensis TaxID=446692 RepID=UPI0020A0B330|nr:hypothetical protein [Acetobacter senegalensis]MCP1197689.1 hypothetical protein [Acetobacter senegalensis]
MTDVPSAEWHLEHSRPERFVDYSCPYAAFDRILHTLLARYRLLQDLNSSVLPQEPLNLLRNSLAFHLYKTAHWWGIQLNVEDTIGEKRWTFLNHVRSHALTNADELVFLNATRREEPLAAGQMAVVLRKREYGSDHCIGLDRVGDYHSGLIVRADDVRWCDYSHDNVVAAWLDGQCVISRPGHGNPTENWPLASEEHSLCSPYIRAFMMPRDHDTALADYRRARKLLDRLQSGLARSELDRVMNKIAYQILAGALHSCQSTNGTQVEKFASLIPAERQDILFRSYVFRDITADCSEYLGIDNVLKNFTN